MVDYYVVETDGYPIRVPAGETGSAREVEVRIAGPTGYSIEVGRVSYRERKDAPVAPAIPLLRARAASICRLLNTEARA